MNKIITPVLSALFLLSLNSLEAQKQKKETQAIYYYPDREWVHKMPVEVGMDAAKLKDAIDFAITNESKNPRSMEQSHYQSFGIREPLSDPIGPLKTRGDANGIIIKNGYVIAEWGDPTRPDMSHSVTKSFLSTVVGLAYDKGLINNIDDLVHPYVAPIKTYNPFPQPAADNLGKEQLLYLFDTPHNKTITWNHLLRQVSDWEGTLWGKPEWADRPSKNPEEWLTRPRNKPGSVYEYNDTRVNVLALSALNVIRKPLPDS